MPESYIRQELKLEFPPIAVVTTHAVPDRAVEFTPSRMGGPCCLLAVKEALQGTPVFLGAATKGCPGMKSGLGFEDSIDMPGGIEYFLSCGRGDGFPPGEKIKKTPAIAKAYYDGLPQDVLTHNYLTFMPIEQVDTEEPRLVMSFANPDQLAGLVSLFAYESSRTDDIYAPMRIDSQKTLL